MPPKRKAAADSVTPKEEPDAEDVSIDAVPRVFQLPPGARGLRFSRWAEPAEAQHDAPGDTAVDSKPSITVAQEVDMTQPEPAQQEPTQPEPPQPEPTLPEPTQQEPTQPEPTQSLPPIRSPPRSSTEVKVKVEVDEAQTEQPPPPPSTTIDIAPDGDLILVVGPEAARFRVYSQVLKISSKYFTRLLSPPLPDELLMRHLDADAINVIMEVLHHRRDIVSGGLDAKRILRSAIAAYEIDCKEAMSFSLYQSLMTTLDYKSLNSPQAFMLLETKRDTLASGPYLDLWPFKSEYIKPDVAVQILRALEDRRDKIRRHLVRMALNKAIHPKLPSPADLQQGMCMDSKLTREVEIACPRVESDREDS
ncbi:hypothetical protein QBC37DRAFT_392598 [Rhypophila decipiens]|uniref:BTB domain-containing protein n=1 Tax=Rhypophila decipiens TaxID=261697 RepID=A0AAN6XW37_9PEZI|nr:hypothetical protein QBC37DRAFT_392598 [Rhypophila decipiens]